MTGSRDSATDARKLQRRQAAEDRIIKARKLQREQAVVDAWFAEKADGGAGLARLGALACDLTGWTWVAGMAVAPVGAVRTVWVGVDAKGRNRLASLRSAAEGGTAGSHGVGQVPDVTDEATGWLLRGLLDPHCAALLVQDRPGRDWHIHGIGVLEPMLGPLPLGVAALTVAVRLGWWTGPLSPREIPDPSAAR
jgi:hypothetical protein